MSVHAGVDVNEEFDDEDADADIFGLPPSQLQVTIIEPADQHLLSKQLLMAHFVLVLQLWGTTHA